MTAAIEALERPPRLQAGNRVAVVAPSGPVDPERLERGCAVLAGWGLDAVTGHHVLDRNGFLAGNDPDRAGDLQAAWCDPSVRAVLCARGGSGAARTLDLLDWRAMQAASPRVLIGSSDATVLHSAVATRLGLASLLGPMPAALPIGGPEPDEPSLEHLRRTLLEPESVQVLAGEGASTVRSGRAVGVTVGGTLALLAGTVGTPEHRPAAGGIALLEDVGEPAYRLDNLMTQLLRSGWFDGVRGVVLGTWVGCGDDAVATVCARLEPLGVPVLAGLPFGHGTPQLTVPLGVTAELDADAGTLTLAEPALA